MKHNHPAIDHSLLSPSGHKSKRPRKAPEKREQQPFYAGVQCQSPKTPEELRVEKVETLRRSAANLRDLAERGMSPRKFRREAARLEREAAELECAP